MKNPHVGENHTQFIYTYTAPSPPPKKNKNRSVLQHRQSSLWHFIQIKNPQAQQISGDHAA